MIESRIASNSASSGSISHSDIATISCLTLSTTLHSLPSRPADSPVGTFEDYQIEAETRLFGFAGRMLTVCRDQSGKRVVVKECLHRPGEELLSLLHDCDHPSFVSFCEVFARDSHRNIPTLMILELLQGNGSLDSVLSSLIRGERPWFWSRVRITRDALSIGCAIFFLHSRGHFHGSVNPSHLLFDDDHHLRLTLSSSVHFRDDRSYDRECFCHRYLSPEFVNGGDLNCSTDVYSLGVLLYELFSGSVIFTRDLSIGDFHSQ
jgi:hypothetical protein